MSIEKDLHLSRCIIPQHLYNTCKHYYVKGLHSETFNNERATLYFSSPSLFLAERIEWSEASPFPSNSIRGQKPRYHLIRLYWMEQCVQSQQDFHGTWLETCRHWPKAEKHLTICCLSLHVHVLNTGNTNPQTALNYHTLLLLYLNQTCPWNSPWCIGLGLITGTSRAHFKATLINVGLEMS